MKSTRAVIPSRLPRASTASRMCGLFRYPDPKHYWVESVDFSIPLSSQERSSHFMRESAPPLDPSYSAMLEREALIQQLAKEYNSLVSYLKNSKQNADLERKRVLVLGGEDHTYMQSLPMMLLVVHACAEAGIKHTMSEVRPAFEKGMDAYLDEGKNPADVPINEYQCRAMMRKHGMQSVYRESDSHGMVPLETRMDPDQAVNGYFTMRLDTLGERIEPVTPLLVTMGALHMEPIYQHLIKRGDAVVLPINATGYPAEAYKDPEFQEESRKRGLEKEANFAFEGENTYHLSPVVIPESMDRATALTLVEMVVERAHQIAVSR